MKLYYEADGVTGERRSREIQIIKETKTYTYFTTGLIKYRMVKETGEVQFGPYWEKMTGYVAE